MSLRPKVVAAVVRKDLHALWPMAAVATLLVLADIVVAEFGLGSLGGSLPLRTLLPFVTQLTYGLLVVAVVQAIQHRVESRAAGPKRALAVVAAVLAIVVGGWATVGVVLIGDAGAQAVWGERE